MNFSARELQRLALPLLACLVLLGAGVWLVTWTDTRAVGATQVLVQTRAERAHAKERLMRIAEEEREVKEKLAVYRRLKDLGVLGEEQRLEWADAMKRIREELELPDLRYRVDRQRALVSVRAKPGTVDFYASMMHVDMALLHEGDLLNFLWDLRRSGRAYYAVRKCGVARLGQSARLTGLAPRLRAECDIDLITIVDHGAKA